MNELIPLESTFSAGRRWQPPLSPDHYDCSPLTAVEWKAVQCCAATDKSQTITPRYREALSQLGRIHQPFEDAYLLGHSAAENSFASGASVVRRTLAKAVCQTRKLFWDWSQAEWLAVLGPSGPQFAQAWGWNAYSAGCRQTFLVAAYLFGLVNDLRPAGITACGADLAATIFGVEVITAQLDRVSCALRGIGYSPEESTTFRRHIKKALSHAFLLRRSPYLEDITNECLSDLATSFQELQARLSTGKIRRALELLGVVQAPELTMPAAGGLPGTDGVDPQWVAWCLAWFEKSGGRIPGIRIEHLRRLYVVGRWLAQTAPHVRTPEESTEELALRFRKDLKTWTWGQFVSPAGRAVVASKGKLGHPIGAASQKHFLEALRAFFGDLMFAQTAHSSWNTR